jgi:hypothetical protein
MILKLFGFAVLLVGSAAAVSHLLSTQSAPPAADRSPPATTRSGIPKIQFYGIVVDEAGAPVADARVSILIMRAPPGTPAPTWDGKGPPPPRLGEHITLHTDSDGKFSLEDEGYTLQVIGGIRKTPEFVDVFDSSWDWPAPFTSRPRFTNRYFIYGGGFPVYVPDKDRPAIFPLHRTGSAVVGMPSRGGADRLADGRIIRNEPTKPLIPSTGPGAPNTDAERQERLRQLQVSEPTTQPSIHPDQGSEAR